MPDKKKVYSDDEVVVNTYDDADVTVDGEGPSAPEKRGLFEGKTLGGLAKNAARNAFIDIPKGLVGLGVGAAKFLGADPIEKSRMVVAAGQGVKDVAQGIGRYAQDVAHDPSRLAQDAVDFAYENPVDAATMVTPAGWGKKAALSVGGKVAPQVTRVLTRDAGKLLTKSDALMDSVLRKTATAERNNPGKNFARILSAEGYGLGMTKGDRGIISKEGASAMAKHVAGLKNEATAMRAASPARVTGESMVQAMERKIAELAKTANDPAELEQARHLLERVKANPDLFRTVEIPNSGPIIGPKFSNVLGPNGQPVQIGVIRGPNQTRVIPQRMSITDYAKRREALRDSNLKKTDAGQWYSPSEYTKKVELAAQHEMRNVERGALGPSYEALQAVRSDLIPAQRIAAASVRNDAHKAMFGLSNMLTLGPGGYAGSKAGTALAGPVGGAVGAVAGGVAGQQLGNYLKSVGRTSARASKLFGKALNAPAHNAAVAAVEPLIAAGINVAPTVTALYDAIRGQVESAQQARKDAAEYYASVSTAKP